MLKKGLFEHWKQWRYYSPLLICLIVGAGYCADVSVATESAAFQTSPEKLCHVRSDAGQIELVAPSFVYTLSIAPNLTAKSWENRLSGEKISMGDGAEFSADFDAAIERVWVTGWKYIRSEDKQSSTSSPNEEQGYKEKYYLPFFDDTTWKGQTTPVPDQAPFMDKDFYFWARTHLFVPRSAQGVGCSLTLGGVGLYDFSYMRVFLNGHEIEVRQAPDRWNDPGVFSLSVQSPAYKYLRFGQDNILAIQATGLKVRDEKLMKLDPQGAKMLPYKTIWPGQFEQYLSVGISTETPVWHVTGTTVKKEGSQAELIVTLQSSKIDIGAKVTYSWDAESPTLHKFVEITNNGHTEQLLMNVGLGSYTTDANISDGEQGFPVYCNDQYFVSVAHPSGWACGQKGLFWLRQYPGTRLASGDTFTCMEVVMGVADAGMARKNFLAHVQNRMRRKIRHHDKAYAIFEPFGGQPSGDYWQTEKYLLDNLSKLAEGQRDSGCHFDYCSIDFWIDPKGDLERFEPKNLPNGIRNIRKELDKLGTAAGLWIDSSCEAWSIGGNPIVGSARIYDTAYGKGQVPILCRATDPFKTMYCTAFRHHIRDNGARLFKFDNFRAICYNPAHSHLPGIYSTEAIQSSVIDFFHELDQECPDVFLMLYWGHRSPWWLLHADTLSEPGMAIEAASPAREPSLYVRDSVTVGLDQAQWFCDDVPAMGKDSLGVWLSDWGWNSSIGSQRWQEAFVMDICRGSLLAQPWTDTHWLDPGQRKEMADFIALLKANVKCFANSKFILGNPWKIEPYGYLCSDGTRAFVALNNRTWSDVSLKLELNSALGLQNGKKWRIYRWYPNPVQLTDNGNFFSESVHIALRPSTVVLLEVVPYDEKPSLGRAFSVESNRDTFDEASREITVSVSPSDLQPVSDPSEAQHKPGSSTKEVTIVPREESDKPEDSNPLPKEVFVVQGQMPQNARGGILVVAVEISRGQQAENLRDIGKYFVIQGEISGHAVACEQVVGNKTHPCSWQAWRINIEPSSMPCAFEFVITTMLPDNVDKSFKAYFVPSEH